MPLFAILTLFPEAIEAYLDASILGIARAKGAAEVRLVDFRDFARDRHRTVDDRPYGGGPGMVLRPEPVVECVEWLESEHGAFRKLMLCPAGRPFLQRDAHELAEEERVLLLCGRYEGFDERIAEVLDFERVSVGDFVLAGGELPALCVLEAAARLLPGVLGDERSAIQESFQARPGPSAPTAGDEGSGAIQLDHPHYTRPRVFRGRAVPEVLLSGDHASIEHWRRSQALRRTASARPDLLEPQGSSPPPYRPSHSSSPRSASGAPASDEPDPKH